MDGRDWLNISKYANAADAPMPAMGEQVKVTLDKAGFVRKVEQIAPAAQVEALQPEQQPAMVPTIDGRDIRITRLAVLNTATAILSSGSRAAEPQEVMSLAEWLENWVLR